MTQYLTVKDHYGYSHAQMAKLLEVSPNTVKKWIKPETCPDDIDKRLRKLFPDDYDYLIDETPIEPPKDGVTKAIVSELCCNRNMMIAHTLPDKKKIKIRAGKYRKKFSPGCKVLVRTSETPTYFLEGEYDKRGRLLNHVWEDHP